MTVPPETLEQTAAQAHDEKAALARTNAVGFTKDFDASHSGANLAFNRSSPSPEPS